MQELDFNLPITRVFEDSQLTRIKQDIAATLEDIGINGDVIVNQHTITVKTPTLPDEDFYAVRSALQQVIDASVSSDDMEELSDWGEEDEDL